MSAILASLNAVEHSVLSVFDECGIVAVQSSSTSSTVSFPGGTLVGEARYGGDWFSLDVPLAARGKGLPSNKRLWSLLDKNRSLAGVKFVIPAGPMTLVTRAEFPLTDIGGSDTSELRLRTANACAAIAAASQESNVPAKTGAAAIDSETEQPDALLQDRLAESGWQCRSGAGNRLLVDLEVPGAFQQVVIEQWRDSICLSVDAMDEELPTDAVCRRAIAIFLLRCAGVSRMASAVMASQDDGRTPRFQIMLSPDAPPSLLGHALSSLHAVCGLCAGEAQVMSQVRDLAQAYLALQRRPVRSDSSTEKYAAGAIARGLLQTPHVGHV